MGEVYFRGEKVRKRVEAIVPEEGLSQYDALDVAAGDETGAQVAEE